MDGTALSTILAKLTKLEESVSEIEASVAFIKEDIDHAKAYLGYDESSGIIECKNDPTNGIHNHINQIKDELKDTINSATNLINNNLDNSVSSLRHTVITYSP